MVKKLFQIMWILTLLACGSKCQAQPIDIAAGPYHLGDDDTVGYVSARSTEREFTFNLDQVPQDIPAELFFEVRGIDRLQNKVIINGYDIGAIPTTPPNGQFFKMKMFFNSNILRSEKNILVLYSRNKAGGDCRNRDDFEIKNIQLRLHPGKQIVCGKTIHLGDDSPAFSIREVSLRGKRFAHTFDLSISRGTIAKLSLDVYDVNYSINTVTLNGVLLGVLPGYPHQAFISYSFLFDAGVLQDKENNLVITAGGTKERDDFQFRNITLEFLAIGEKQ